MNKELPTRMKMDVKSKFRKALTWKGSSITRKISDAGHVLFASNFIKIMSRESSNQEPLSVEFEVKRLIGKRVLNLGPNQYSLEYLVQWADNETSWEPSPNLINAAEKVRKFEERLTRSRFGNQKRIRRPETCVVGYKRIFVIESQGAKKEIEYEEAVRKYPEAIIEFYEGRIRWKGE